MKKSAILLTVIVLNFGTGVQTILGFGYGGIVTTAIGVDDDRGHSTAIQVDGKIVVVGSSWESDYGGYFALVRYNANGSRDANFGTNGKVITDFGGGAEANSVALQSDGKIVVAGFSYNGSDQDFALARYNSDGTLDTGFGASGLVTTAVGDDLAECAWSVALQSDGKIVIVGYSSSASIENYAVLRYNSDGSLDTDFGTDGVVITDLGDRHGEACAVAIQSDGKILVAGYAETDTLSTELDYQVDFILLRYDSNGSLDTDFGTSGYVATTFGDNWHRAFSIAIQTDGRIVVAGEADSQFAAARYNTDGSLDTGFGSEGKVTEAFGDFYSNCRSVALQQDGKIVMGGTESGRPSNKFALMRYDTDGSFDANFGIAGKVTTSIGNGWVYGYSLAIKSDGGIVLAGIADMDTTSNINFDFALACYNSDGSLNTTPITLHQVPLDFATIQAAIDGAADGDTVLVYPGTYVENINFNGKNIVLESTGGSSETIIDGGSSGNVVSIINGEGFGTVIKGFTIQNGGSTNFGGGIYCLGSNPTLQDLIIKNNTVLTSGGGICCNNSSPTIKNVVITNNHSDEQGGGVFCDWGSDPVFVNVTIYGNYAAINGGAICSFVSNPSFINSIIWNNSTVSGLDIYNGSDQNIYPISLSYCNAEEDWSGTGNINEIPEFVDAENCDYHLFDFSPCIGAGIDSSIVIGVDLDGDQRPYPIGSSPDMGAYENQLGTPIIFQIIINEVLQNPSITTDSEGEWFELYNPNSANIQLQNWSFQDNGSDTYTIPEPLIIPAFGYLTFGANDDNSTNGDVTIDHEYSTFTLGNSNDEIILKDGYGRTLDSVAWDGGPNFPDPTGASMALLDPTLDNSLGLNWAESSTPFGLGDLGTPGLPNFLSNIVLTPMALDFDTVFVNEPSELILSIGNDGNASLQIDTIYTNNPLFSFSFTDSLIETSADLRVTFTPIEYGEVSANLYVLSNDPNDGLVEIPLSGFGYFLAPEIELQSTLIDFGDVMVGLIGVEQFQIYNTGEGVLELDSIYCTEHFSLSSSNGLVAPGDSLSLEITFTPDGEASFFGAMTVVAGNDHDEDSLTVVLAGVGTAQAPIMTVSNTELYFGAVIPNETVSREVTIYNEGMLDLEIEELNITGGEFFSTSFSDASLAPGDSVEIEFTFSSMVNLAEVEETATIIAAGVANQVIQLTAGYYGPIWFVSTEGSNENGDGTLQFPFATIQYGIDSASPFDTVLIAPGLYESDNQINIYSYPIVLGSHFLLYPDSTILVNETIVQNINNSNQAILIENQGIGSEIRGITVTVNADADYANGIRIENTQNIYLRDLQLTGFGAIFGTGFGAWVENSDSIFIDRVEFADNNLPNSGGGLYSSQSWVTVHNSVFHGNIGYAGYAVYANSGVININHCTFAENYVNYDPGEEASAIYASSNSVVNISNSILWENSTSLYAYENGIINVQYSNVQGGWEGEGNIDADPLFCDPEAGDYILAESSPCVGTGLNGTNMGAWGIGCAEPVSLNEISIPTQYMLEQNYPNPFNPTTTIRYGLPGVSNVSIVIYDIRGGAINKWQVSDQNAGRYDLVWNGIDEKGLPVSTGIYLARLQAGSYTKTIKMLYLK